MSESSRSIAPNRSQGFSAGTCVGKLLFFTFEENLTIWALYAEPGLFLYLLARYPRRIGQRSRSFCSGIFHLARLPTLRLTQIFFSGMSMGGLPAILFLYLFETNGKKGIVSTLFLHLSILILFFFFILCKAKRIPLRMYLVPFFFR